jgi:hypothetical protein
MTYNAEVQFKFDATWEPTYGTSSWTDDTMLPEEHYLITAPAGDLNCKQYFKLFEKFLLCVGMDHKTILSSAMSLVFNDCIGEDEQRKICNEYELTMDEDLNDKFEDWKKRDEDIARLHKGPMGTVENFNRYDIFTKYTDDQLKEIVEYGEKMYYMGQD